MKQNDAFDAVRSLMHVHAKERPRFDDLHDYLQPWTANEAARRMGLEFGSRNYNQQAEIARLSQSPFVGLVLDTYGQSLKVDGFFNSDFESAGSWQWWQRNRMDARQTGLNRAALQYGTSYATALPSEGGGVYFGCHSPRRMVAVYGEPFSLPGTPASSDEWPIMAMSFEGGHLRLFDEEKVYYFGVERSPGDPSYWVTRDYLNPENIKFIESREHGLGVTPVVRFQDRTVLDGEETYGIVEHLLGMADRINRTNFEQGVAQYFAAFKQRYITGWLPPDTMTALKQNAAETMFFADSDVKAGQFDETDLTRYIDSRQAAVRDFAAVAQVPAQSLGANAISNVSADGLAALETSKDRKVAEIQTSLGESYEQLLRLASFIDGDDEGAKDFGSEIKWAETSARSFAQTVDGLGKLATMLHIPAQELWSDIPGWTRERVQRAQRAASEAPEVEEAQTADVFGMEA